MVVTSCLTSRPRRRRHNEKGRIFFQRRSRRGGGCRRRRRRHSYKQCGGVNTEDKFMSRIFLSSRRENSGKEICEEQ